MTKIALGKGLGALIPSDESTEQSVSTYRMVPLDRIEPNPLQPRHDFDPDRLAELAESLKQTGMLQPLVVRTREDGFTIIAGERRYRAAQQAGLAEVPVVVVDDVDDTRMLEMALVENIQREDLNAIDLAEAYRRLVEQCGLTQQKLAERVGKSRAAVANQLRLLSLPDDVKDLVRRGQLTEGHARTLVSLDSAAAMRRMARKIMAGELSVREAERQAGRQKRKRLVPKRKMPEIQEAESYLKRLFGTAVKINHSLKRGRIEIEYYGDDDLTRLLELFRRIE